MRVFIESFVDLVEQADQFRRLQQEGTVVFFMYFASSGNRVGEFRRLCALKKGRGRCGPATSQAPGGAGVASAAPAGV
jgi:hypothetical protein